MEESGRVNQKQSARTADVNSQIRSLVPGQTIRGEIVSRNGGEVQIRVSEDMVLNARVDQSIYLEQGKNVTFEVKNNGRALSLSPLFTNVATDANVLKALDMAGISVNKTSVAMTEQLMEAGLPVNKSTLQQIYREINSFPEYEISDVINLHRMQMPVNEVNMQQMASYRNLTHQLINGLTDVLESLPQAAENMLAAGNPQGTAELYRTILGMAGEPFTVSGEFFSTAETGGLLSEVGEEALQSVLSEMTGEAAVELINPQNSGKLPAAGEETAGKGAGEAVSGEQAAGNGAILSAEEKEILAGKLLQTLEELPLSPGESAALAERIRQFGAGGLSAEALFELTGKLLEAGHNSEKGMAALHRLFSGKEFETALTRQLKAGWTLQPEEVAERGKIEEFYSRIDRQLKGLVRTLEAGGQAGSAAHRAAANVSQNVDFMNQINQVYAYVQLPLRLQHSDAHGDLYVYTNRRSFSDRDGTVSALLHLDMERLGPVDVYVALQDTKVNTRFYVADDGILDFIEEHLDLLTQRLQKRGYDCSCSMTLKNAGEEEADGGLAPLLQQEKGILLSQYAFDVRT